MIRSGATKARNLQRSLQSRVLVAGIRPNATESAIVARCSELQTMHHERVQNSVTITRRGFATSRRQNNVGSASDPKRKPGQRQPKHQPFLDLEEAQKAMDNLLSRVSKINSDVTKQERVQMMMSIVKDTKSFFIRLQKSVEDNRKFNPSGKHGKQLSKWLELVLYVYNQLDFPPSKKYPSNVSLFNESQLVLETLEEWYLDIRSRHYDYAIAIANRERKYKEASEMFWNQISPEAGYNPTDVEIVNPHGLFAIAKYAQQQNAAVVENVFDAVQQLTMVSPGDQRTYVLAAGTALGQAGEWESAIQYLNSTSASSSKANEVLVAAVMHACLLCDRPNEALEVFDSHVPNPNDNDLSREWQWGGESDLVDPLCRDLALRSIRSSQDKSWIVASGYLQDILAEGSTPISLDALLGITLTCEQDSNPDLALQVLLSLCDSTTTTQHSPGELKIVTGDEMFIVDDDRDRDAATDSFDESWLPMVGKILASTMRTCNSASKFGTSLFCLQLISLYSEKGRQSGVCAGDLPNVNLHDSVFELSAKTRNRNELIKPAMVALCGLRCSHKAVELYDQAYRSNKTVRVPKALDTIYKSALSQQETVIHVGNPWVSSEKHIGVLADATRAVQTSNRNLQRDEKACFENVLATAMRACTAAHQPDLSLAILAWVENTLDSSIAAEQSSGNRGWMADDKSGGSSNFEMTSDAVLAESISARQWKDRNEACQLFEALLDSKSNELDRWRLSCNAGLSALIANSRGNDAWAIFKVLDHKALTTESYTSLGRYLAKEQRWNDLADLYRSAGERGHLSEDLSLLAMKAIVFSKVDNRLRVLRSIVRDSADTVGLDPIGWTVSRYWNVKRAIGFNYARLLMWWNDPETCHIHELDFAIQKFRQEREGGLRAKKDVIKAIIEAIRSHDRDILENKIEGEWQNVPSSAEDWNVLLGQILEETRTSTIRNDSAFVDDLVEACLLLGFTRDSMEFVQYLLDRGCRLNRKTLQGALEAAKFENARGLESDLVMLLSERSLESDLMN